MIDLGDEVAFWWAEGVVGGKVDVEEEDATLVGAIIGANNGGLPMELVVVVGAGRTVGRGILLEVK